MLLASWLLTMEAIMAGMEGTETMPDAVSFGERSKDQSYGRLLAGTTLLDNTFGIRPGVVTGIQTLERLQKEVQRWNVSIPPVYINR